MTTLPAAKRRRLSPPVKNSSEDDSSSFASFADTEEDFGSSSGSQSSGKGRGFAVDQAESSASEASEDADLEKYNIDNATEDGRRESGQGESYEDEEERESHGPFAETAKPSARAETGESTKDTSVSAQNRRRRSTEAIGASYTGEVYKSNMFKMQVDELLGHMRPRRGKIEKHAEAMLHRLKTIIEQIPNCEPVSSLFQDKDYLNYRYFYKRAYYLACIAVGLKSATKDDIHIRFDYLNDNALQPIIVVQPTPVNQNESDTMRWRINIIPGAPEGVFPAEKLLPDRNCVRPAKSGDDVQIVEGLPPTPYYNATLRADTQATSYLQLLHGASTTCEAYKDACLLGRIWLRQRSLGSRRSQGGFGNFEWAAIMAVLLHGAIGTGAPLLSPGYSSYQLFKATLQILATRDMATRPLLVQANNISIPPSQGRPTLFDGARSHNILFKMSAWSYKLLRHEARTTLNMLGESLSDNFEAAFIVRVDNPLLRYDLIADIPEYGDDGHSSEVGRDERMYSVLSEGLGERVALITVSAPGRVPWDVCSHRADPEGLQKLRVQFIVNPDNVNRAVDHGPSAESKQEAAAFRKFWGEKAELRRFKDGSILESLVWSTGPQSLSVIEQIVSFLLERHFGKATSEATTFLGSGYARLLRGPQGLGQFQPLMEAFKTLEDDIRGMEGMPLTIRQISPSHPLLSYTSLGVPILSNKSIMKEPADVTLQFEGSGRWPDDLVAIQRTKIAFLLKLSSLFQDAGKGVTTRVGLENGNLDIFNQSFLDVVYDSGATFRIRIHHDREQILLDRRLKDKSLDPKSRETAAQALAAYKRDFVRKPAHVQALQKLCTRYLLLSPTIRLVKKWFSSHLLSAHFAPALIELLTVRTFAQPYPWQAPSSIMTGFLRTLFFVSRWDWRSDPWIVNLGGRLKAEDIATINTRFQAWRKIDPALNRIALFAASDIDLDGTTWTDGQPARVVAARMTALAKAAMLELDAQKELLDPASLFVSPLQDFDFVVHVSAEFSARGQKKTKSTPQYKNLQIQAGNDASLVGFSPVQSYIHEVKRLYGQAVLLFYDTESPSVVAGLWSPYTAKRAWKVNLAYSTVPSKNDTRPEEADLDINKDGILAEIARLGGDLIDGIEDNRR
ncbi:U3 snoRNP protein [Elasticomyces elasticus]|nr:U3 snoRNP protein [Elasticomyces elasticus]